MVNEARTTNKKFCENQPAISPVYNKQQIACSDVYLNPDSVNTDPDTVYTDPDPDNVYSDPDPDNVYADSDQDNVNPDPDLNGVNSGFISYNNEAPLESNTKR
jgi:hypothetical protein